MDIMVGERRPRAAAASQKRFVDFPARVDESAYEEAVRRYSRAVGSRALAVYHGGRARFPGLSDIDLLVVVDDKPAWDNDEFFSPFVRLPRSFHCLFHHRPHFVTRSSIDALAFSTFAYKPRRSRVSVAGTDDGGFRRRLVAGSDVVPKTWPALPDSWYACSLMETAITARQRFEHFRAGKGLSVRRLASMAATFRFPLLQLDELHGTGYEPAYSAIVDRSRAELLEPAGERASAASVLYTLYAAALAGFERTVGELAEAPAGENALDAARDVLAGRRRVASVDPAYLLARRAALAAYFERLRATKITGMSIFVREPYRSEVPLYHQPAWVGKAAAALRTVNDALAARLHGPASPSANAL